MKKLQGSFLRDEQFDLAYKGLLAAIDMLSICHDFMTKLAEGDIDSSGPYRKELQLLQDLFADPRLQWLKMSARHSTFTFTYHSQM